MIGDPSRTSSTRKELVKARWGILRNALLQGAQQQQQQQKHSIHRFSGYNLLHAKPADSDSAEGPELSIHQIEPWLTKYRWESAQNDSLKNNIDRLEIAILALAACFPKGKCMRILSAAGQENNNSDSAVTPSFSEKWLESIKERCHPCVRVWKVNEELEGHDEANEQMPKATTVTTILVQESSTATKFQALRYDFGDTFDRSDRMDVQNNATEKSSNLAITNDTDQPYRHIIWTREPRETRLSLDDLVSHRKNKGVDNTGNICVWDSERTLAYLLYHNFDDFFLHSATGDENINTIASIVCRCNNTDGGPNYDEIMKLQSSDSTNNAGIRILELGTGMAGLSAVALGLRLAMLQQKYDGKTRVVDADETGHEGSIDQKSIHITLTDGNPSGVKNNAVNQYLTKLNSQATRKQNKNCSHYLNLDVKCETLLWTTDMSIDNDSFINQDVVLVSDCVHFQNFHAALATTTLRCLRLGASAVFCQPTRGPSLDNFFNLLSTASSDSDDSIGSTPLLTCAWLSHQIIEQKHHEALMKHKSVYDENLHYPKILVVTKLREMVEGDRVRFVAYQHSYSPIIPTTGENLY